MVYKRKVGIMGGTFDPIHYGHLVIAEVARNEYKLEKVIFIPNSIPPHKKPYHITDAEDRLMMVEMAIANNSHFETSRIELERNGPSYTVDTLLQLTKDYPDTEFFMITGADAIIEIMSWRQADVLVGLCSFIAANRPGYNKQQLQNALLKLPTYIKDKIYAIEIPGVAISSTEVRQRIAEYKPVRYLLPEAVENFIYQKKLYKKAKM